MTQMHAIILIFCIVLEFIISTTSNDKQYKWEKEKKVIIYKWCSVYIEYPNGLQTIGIKRI